ncbi:MAG: hypothetical protein PHF70_01410 [Opitutales bacterium]|nr:hypothetical protein [Opitutales bacterium]
MTYYEGLSVLLQSFIAVVATATCVVYYCQLRIMFRQLSAMQESSKAQSGLELVEFLQTPEVREARHHVRELLSKKLLADWTPDDRKSAALVVANYDVAAALIRGGLGPVSLIAGNWGPSIKHCYEILRPYIEEQRKRDGGCPTYWSNFEWLYSQC